MATYKQLQTRCKKLKLSPCSGPEITKAVLLAKIRKAEEGETPSEERLKARDPEFHEEIRLVVGRMPDVRPFESEYVKGRIAPWTEEQRWKTLLEELEALEESPEAEDHLIMEYVNEGALLPQEVNEGGGSEFFIRYPALSWILLITRPELRPLALQLNYIDWLIYAKLTLQERKALLLNVVSYEAMASLLDPVPEKDLPYPARSPYEQEPLFILRYLIERGRIPETERIPDIVQLGDLRLMKSYLQKIKGWDIKGINIREGEGLTLPMFRLIIEEIVVYAGNSMVVVNAIKTKICL